MFLFFYVANIDIQHIRRKVNINRRLNFANSLMANLLTFNLFPPIMNFGNLSMIDTSHN